MQQTVCQRISREVFEVCANSQYRKRILFFPITPQFPYQVKLMFRHFNPGSFQQLEQQVTIKYPSQYPKLPPSIDVASKSFQIPQILLMSPLLEPATWNAQTTLLSILTNMYELIDIYWQCQSGFGKNVQFTQTINQNTNASIHSKNLFSPHNQSMKLSNLLIIQFVQICSQISSFTQDSPILQIIEYYNLKRIGEYETLKKLLNISELRERLRQELADGKWVHRILKSAISIKFKKELIRCQTKLYELIQQLEAQQSKKNQEKQHEQQQI